MNFQILRGKPHVEELFEELEKKFFNNLMSLEERKRFKRLLKTFELLSNDPFHNSLHSHEIISLSEKYGIKVFESYVENNTPRAMRIFWSYGPDKNQITLTAIELHPDKNKYTQVNLSVKTLKKSGKKE